MMSDKFTIWSPIPNKSLMQTMIQEDELLMPRSVSSEAFKGTSSFTDTGSSDLSNRNINRSGSAPIAESPNNSEQYRTSVNTVLDGSTSETRVQNKASCIKALNKLEEFTSKVSEHSETKGEPMACIFVASLNALRTDDQLTKSVTAHFQNYGQLLDVKVQRDWQGRPYAFVQFAAVSDAQVALEKSNDQIIDSRHIRLEQARVNRTLFIAKFDKELSKEGFRKMVEEYGAVDEVSLLHNFQTGKSRGCGFVKYKYRDDAIRAFSGLRGEHNMVVQWAANLEKDPQTIEKCSIFIGRLNSEHVNEELIRENFSRFGEIESVNLVQTSSPRPSFAFVKYTSEDSAQKAIESENGREWLGRYIRVKVKEVNPEHDSSASRQRTESVDSMDTLYQAYQPMLPYIPIYAPPNQPGLPYYQFPVNPYPDQGYHYPQIGHEGYGRPQYYIQYIPYPNYQGYEGAMQQKIGYNTLELGSIEE